MPSFEADAILVESLLKLKLYTPAECPFNSNALLTSWNSPDLVKHTSHTFTSGVKPLVEKQIFVNNAKARNPTIKNVDVGPMQ